MDFTYIEKKRKKKVVAGVVVKAQCRVACATWKRAGALQRSRARTARGAGASTLAPNINTHALLFITTYSLRL